MNMEPQMWQKNVPYDLEINCTILINSNHGYCFNEIMDEKKIEEMFFFSWDHSMQG